VAFAFGEGVGDFGQIVHLIGGEDATWDLRPNHVDAGLALGIDTAAEALGAELIIGQFAGDVAFGGFPELFDVLANGGVEIGFDFLPGYEVWILQQFKSPCSR
jgi:hypothetical protein